MSETSDKLTAKEERFAQLIARGMTNSDALREVNPGCLKWKSETVWSKGSELAKKVSARVDEIRAELAEQGIWSRVQSVRALVKVVENPDKSSDVVAAIKELNAMHGFNEPVKVDHTNSDGSFRKPTKDDIEKELIALGIDPKKIALEE